MTRYIGTFNDAAVYDAKTKSAVSVRDGVIEYLGSELRQEPADKMFTVYRSPATIANAASRMPGLPITDGHVDLERPPPTDGGFVAEASMIDATDATTRTTIAIKNKLTLGDTMNASVEAGRRELSLAYRAELIPHDGECDFEQRDIAPLHLAIVDQGRCGPMCSFIDKKPDGDPEPMNTKLHKLFCDAEGKMNLQQIVELSTALPEAIKSVPVDQLQKLLPALQQIVEAAKGAGAQMPEAEPTEDEQVKLGGEPKAPIEDEDMTPEEKKKHFSDAVAAAAAKGNQTYADAAIKQHITVVEKARDFMPEGHSFADQSTDQVMRAALATETAETFADSELPLAFKMLKKPAANYREFGDSTPQDLNSVADQEI